MSDKKDKKAATDEKTTQAKHDHIRTWLMTCLLSSLLMPAASVLFTYLTKKEVKLSATTADVLLVLNAFLFSSYSFATKYVFPTPERKRLVETRHRAGIIFSGLIYLVMITDVQEILVSKSTVCFIVLGIAVTIYLIDLIWYTKKEYDTYVPENSENVINKA